MTLSYTNRLHNIFYNHGTIEEHDLITNAIGIDTAGYGHICYNIDAVLKI